MKLILKIAYKISEYFKILLEIQKLKKNFTILTLENNEIIKS